MNNIELNPFFNLKEFECPCCHTLIISSVLLWKLTCLRCLIDKPILINSAYRCPSENTAINGDRNSYHMKGMAVDVWVKDFYLDNLYSVAKQVGFTGIGFYIKKNFLHLDVRPGKLKIWKDPPD